MKKEEGDGEEGGGRRRNAILEKVDIWKFLEDLPLKFTEEANACQGVPQSS